MPVSAPVPFLNQVHVFQVTDNTLNHFWAGNKGAWSVENLFSAAGIGLPALPAQQPGVAVFNNELQVTVEDVHGRAWYFEYTPGQKFLVGGAAAVAMTTFFFVLGSVVAVCAAARAHLVSLWSFDAVELDAIGRERAAAPLPDHGRMVHCRWADRGVRPAGRHGSRTGPGRKVIGAIDDCCPRCPGCCRALALAFDLELFGSRLPIHRRQVNERWLDQFRPWVYGWDSGSRSAWDWPHTS